MSELVERLGYPADSKLLIVGCANLGQAHAANIGVYEAIRDGLGTTATLMVPCPWARDAAARYRGEDIGVQLTVNADFETYRWGPVTHAPSLLDGDGGFPRTAPDLWDHADIDEIRRECRAQLERAILWGFRVSHLSSHLDALQQRPEFFDAYLDIACEYRLPIHLPSATAEQAMGFPARKLAAEEGILAADHVVEVRGPSRAALEGALFDLAPGVTEISLKPAHDLPELRALDPNWSRRVEDYLLATQDAGMADLVRRSGVTLISYREIQALMAASD